MRKILDPITTYAEYGLSLFGRTLKGEDQHY